MKIYQTDKPSENRLRCARCGQLLICSCATVTFHKRALHPQPWTQQTGLELQFSFDFWAVGWTQRQRINFSSIDLQHLIVALQVGRLANLYHFGHLPLPCRTKSIPHPPPHQSITRPQSLMFLKCATATMPLYNTM
jgi:hypothetical protein